MREGNKRIWTVPNALTMLRLLLIPVYWNLITVDRERAALVVFILASLTDLLDGYIARKYNLVTDFGKLFDPLADKLMVMSVMSSLTIRGILPWPALAIILAKELLMVIGSCILLRHELVVYAKPIGKFAQFIIVVALVASFFHAEYGAFPVHLALLWAGIALTIGAFFYYLIMGLRALHNTQGATARPEEDSFAAK